jgi:hypothetical protein
MRRVTLLAAVAVLCATLHAAEDKAKTFTFAKDDVGKVPAGWKADQTHKGKDSSIWKVVADDTAPSKKGYVLAQTAKSPNAVFNLCVVQDSRFKDGEISVALKAIRGENDQGGGIVWRYQDADNYYIARMNPLEFNYRVYKVVTGVRKELKRKEKLKVKDGVWYALKIKHDGNHIECFLDGKKMLDAKDGTFTKAGKVGLWSKSDAQTHFDDFRVRSK